MTFQKQVYINPAQALPGDFAGPGNPDIYKLSGTGRCVADASGVLVGQFAVLNADGTVTSVPGAAPSSTSRIGFVHREMNAQIVTWMAESGYTIQPGQPVSLFGRGAFWVNADAVTGTPSRGATILWDTTTGKINIGGTATATLIDSGYIMISESATVNQTVAISNNGA